MNGWATVVLRGIDHRRFTRQGSSACMVVSALTQDVREALKVTRGTARLEGVMDPPAQLRVIFCWKCRLSGPHEFEDASRCTFASLQAGRVRGELVDELWGPRRTVSGGCAQLVIRTDQQAFNDELGRRQTAYVGGRPLWRSRTVPNRADIRLVEHCMHRPRSSFLAITTAQGPSHGHQSVAERRQVHTFSDVFARHGHLRFPRRLCERMRSVSVLLTCSAHDKQTWARSLWLYSGLDRVHQWFLSFDASPPTVRGDQVSATKSFTANGFTLSRVWTKHPVNRPTGLKEYAWMVSCIRRYL